MKITKLSLATVIAFAATTTFAANDIASAFKEGKLDGRLRAHYMGADYEDFEDILDGVSESILRENIIEKQFSIPEKFFKRAIK